MYISNYLSHIKNTSNCSGDLLLKMHYKPVLTQPLNQPKSKATEKSFYWWYILHYIIVKHVHSQILEIVSLSQRIGTSLRWGLKVKRALKRIQF